MTKKLQSSGASPDVIEKELAKMSAMKESCKNPIFRILYTYLEILPLGILVSLILALVLKRKPKVSGN